MESFRTQNIAQVKEKGHNKEIGNLAGENRGKIDCGPFFFLLFVLWDKNTDVTKAINILQARILLFFWVLSCSVGTGFSLIYQV